MIKASLLWLKQSKHSREAHRQTHEMGYLSLSERQKGRQMDGEQRTA